jgi:anti-sigma factor RsiW
VNCQEVQHLIDGYVDNELDLVSNMDVERHLQTCSECTHLYHNRQKLQALIRSGKLSEKAPAHLETRIQASLRQADRTAATWQRTTLRLLAVAAVLIMALLTTWSLFFRNGFPYQTAPSSAVSEAFVQSVLSSHIRSLMVNHLVDVASTDQHTVKPWFDGKLDYAPVVIDLTPQGYPLVGGRLDYLDNRAVAALIYKHETHVINLFTWPSTTLSAVTSQVTTVTRQGYHLTTWTQGGMVYWAVSDIEEDKLQTFVQLLQRQISAPVMNLGLKARGLS